MGDLIPVVLCFDGSYANYAAVTAFSVLIHARTPVRMYCVTPRDAAEGLQKVRGVAARFGCDMRGIVADDRFFQGWKTRDHLSPATYLRFLIPDLVEERRAIYLDTDLIVQDDLAALFATPFAEGAVVAGVPDMFDGADTKIPRAKGDPYINGGVLLLDLEALRRDRFLQRCAEIRAEFAEQVVWPSQCVLNKYAEGRKVAVDRRWNRLVLPQKTSKEEWQKLVSGKDSAIIHFVNSTKPWASWCNPPIAEFWWGYARPLGLVGLVPTPVKGLREIMSLAKLLDAEHEYAEASRVKEQAIRMLLERSRSARGSGQPGRQSRR